MGLYEVSSKLLNDSITRKYNIDFLVKHSEELTTGDKEKIYRILRILTVLGDDSVLEEEDKDYRFRTDQDDATLDELIDGYVEKDKKSTPK